MRIPAVNSKNRNDLLNLNKQGNNAESSVMDRSDVF